MPTSQELAAQLSVTAEADSETGYMLLLNNRSLISRELIDELRAIVRRRLAQNLAHARRIAQLTLAAVDLLPEPDLAASGSAHWAMGNVHYFSNEVEQGIARYRQAIAYYQAVDGSGEAQQVQGNLLGALMDFGALDEAEQIGQALLERLKTRPIDLPAFNLRLNLGTLAQRRGQYAASLEHLREAEHIALTLDAPVRRAQALVNQAVSAEKLDRLEMAEALLDTARDLFQAAGELADEGLAWLNRAILDYRQGRWQPALIKFDRAAACFETAELDDELPTVWQYRARCYLALNLAREALQAARAAETAFSARKMPREVAYAAQTQGAAYRALRQPILALLGLDRAWRLLNADGEQVEAALVSVQRASVLIDLQQPMPAQVDLGAAMEILTALDFPVRHAQAQIEAARGWLAAGQVPEALQALNVAWRVGRRAGVQPPAHLSFPIHYLRGIIAEAAGRIELAQSEYEAAIAAAQLVNQQLTAIELRSGWMDDKRPAIEAGIRLALQREDLAGAFFLSEQARTAVLQNLPPDNADESANSITRLKARWMALITDPAASAPSVSPEALLEIERALADAYRSQFIRDSREMECTQVLTVSQLQAALTASAALFVFEMLGDELLVWVMTTTDVQVVRQLASISMLRREVIGLIHMMEEVLLFESTCHPQLVREVEREARGLARRILDPLSAVLPPTITQMTVVPVGPLVSLPWQLLWEHSGAARDIRIELTTAARQGSVAHRHAWSGLATETAACVLGFSPDDQLPFVSAEAQAVAALWPGECHVGEAATTQSLLAGAPHASIIHIAAHAVFRHDNPMFSALRLADGWLTAHDVLRLPLLHRPLVVLSACQTGAVVLRGGEVLGLVGSFLQAGASAVVVSQWRVDDAPTTDLMREFYRQLKLGQTPVAALWQAQQTIRTLQPHPYYWAGFNVWTS